MGVNVTNASLVPNAAVPNGARDPRAPFSDRDWYTAYLAALFESNRSRLSARIRHAEQQMVERERTLFSVPNASREQQAIANALHALEALRSCCGVS
jgi:hypothetical protein